MHTTPHLPSSVPHLPTHLTDAQLHLLRLAQQGKYYLHQCYLGTVRAGRKKTLAWLLRAGLLAHPAPGQKLHTLTPAGTAALAAHTQPVNPSTLVTP